MPALATSPFLGEESESRFTGAKRRFDPNALRSKLNEHRVGYGSVASHLPRLNGIEMNGAGTLGFRPVLYWDLPVLAQLRHRRLNVTGFIRAARLNNGLLSVPSPVIGKPCMRL